MDEAIIAAVASVEESRVDILTRLVEETNEKILDLPVDDQGNVVLHLACRLGRTDCIRAVLKSDSSCCVTKNSLGLMPLEVTKASALVETASAFRAELVSRLGATSSPETAPRAIAKVFEIVEAGADLGPDLSSNYALHWAAVFDCPPRILDAVGASDGATVVCRNAKGNTPAHEASMNGSLRALEYLLNVDPSVLSVRNDANETVAHVASSSDVENFVTTFTPSTSTRATPKRETEIQRLTRLVEEKDELISNLRDAIASLLIEDGVSKYVDVLQDQIRTLSKTSDPDGGAMDPISRAVKKADDATAASGRLKVDLNDHVHEEDDGEEESFLGMLWSAILGSDDEDDDEYDDDEVH